jgi:hypothetical protein
LAEQVRSRITSHQTRHSARFPRATAANLSLTGYQAVPEKSHGFRLLGPIHPCWTPLLLLHSLVFHFLFIVLSLLIGLVREIHCCVKVLSHLQYKIKFWSINLFTSCLTLPFPAVNFRPSVRRKCRGSYDGIKWVHLEPSPEMNNWMVCEISPFLCTPRTGPNNPRFSEALPNCRNDSTRPPMALESSARELKLGRLFYIRMKPVAVQKFAVRCSQQPYEKEWNGEHQSIKPNEFPQVLSTFDLGFPCQSANWANQANQESICWLSLTTRNSRYVWISNQSYGWHKGYELSFVSCLISLSKIFSNHSLESACYHK